LRGQAGAPPDCCADLFVIIDKDFIRSFISSLSLEHASPTSVEQRAAFIVHITRLRHSTFLALGFFFSCL
jgi:hypothetical protein